MQGLQGSRNGHRTLALLIALALPAAASAAPIWRDRAAPADAEPQALIERWVDLDERALRQALAEQAKRSQPLQIDLPLPAGGSQRFRLWPSAVMAPELAARYPEIQTFAGESLDGLGERLRLTLSPLGVSAMRFGQEGISVLQAEAKGYRVLQRETVAARSQLQCGVGPAQHPLRPAAAIDPDQRKVVGGSLRRYRAAIAATGEYTAFFGGTKPGALAGIVDAVNRVNQVFENEVGITLQLIGNNDAIIYTDAATDPYTNDNGSTLLDENQANVDAVIGSANYDLGHVFSTGGGGVAQLQSPCDAGSKAQGVTGSPAPTGDPFWIDYVAHEMGHQMGGFHTFNDGATGACDGNRDQTTAFEPGSGSTIMAYAGICGATGSFSLQANSDPYFHVGSLAQMQAYAQNTNPGFGGSCGVVINENNAAPVITQTLPSSASNPDAVIPARTPFFLDGAATDSNGDTLSYAWEQLDTGAASPPMDDDGTRAIIRSYSPSSSPRRIVPRLSNLLAGTTTFGETLPTTSRTLTFRLTVRDGQGGARWSGEAGQANDVVLQVVDTGAAFAITSPNTAVTLTAGTAANLSWNVSGTAGAPINCANVVVGWSNDGGQSVSAGTESSVPNSGAASVTVPNVTGSQVRLRLRCASSPFFDISDANFTVNAAGPPPGRVFYSGFEDPS